MMTVAIAAEIAGVHESLIQKWCRSGLLPHYQFRKGARRGIILIDPDEFEGFMAGLQAGRVREKTGGKVGIFLADEARRFCPPVSFL